MGVVRLSLAKNLAFNIVNEKTTLGLLKAMSNMYEKPSVSNKVFLIRQLVNTKMTDGAAVAGHVNEFNSVISKLLAVNIKFDDEMDMILGEDIRRRKFGEYLNSLLSATGHGRKSNRGRSGSRKKSPSKNTGNITCWNYGENGHIRSQCECLIPCNPVHENVKELQLASWEVSLGRYKSSRCCGYWGRGSQNYLWHRVDFEKYEELVKVREPKEVSKLVGAWGVSGSYVLRLTGYSGQEFSHEALICEWQIGVSVQWEQAMVRMSSLWENQTWFFGQVTSGKANRLMEPEKTVDEASVGLLQKSDKGYRLELEVSDNTAAVVVVKFDESATSLDEDSHSPLPNALANIMGTTHILELKAHTYYEHDTYESFTCWRIVAPEEVGKSGGSSAVEPLLKGHPPLVIRSSKQLSVATPSKPTKEKKHKRVELEDSDAEASFVADT
ncbi:hypothetical protein Tco_1155536 [Tanacetum coccineum]